VSPPPPPRRVLAPPRLEASRQDAVLYFIPFRRVRGRFISHTHGSHHTCVYSLPPPRWARPRGRRRPLISSPILEKWERRSAKANTISSRTPLSLSLSLSLARSVTSTQKNREDLKASRGLGLMSIEPRYSPPPPSLKGP